MEDDKKSLQSMVDQESSLEEKEMLPRKQEKWDWKKEALFFTMFVTNMFAFMTYSLMAPLFPREAEAKGLSYTIQGMIFGSYSLTQLVVSPLIGKIMLRVGLKRTFITGILFVSVWNIAFGFLPFLEDRTLFTISCFTCRIGMALGIVAVNNAVFVIVALTWTQDISFRFVRWTKRDTFYTYIFSYMRNFVK